MIYRILAFICLVLFAGCSSSDERFYSKLGQINSAIDTSLASFESKQYTIVVEALDGLDAEIDEVASDFPEHRSELMPHFQKALIYAMLSIAHENLGEKEHARLSKLAFKEELEELEIDMVAADAFLDRVIETKREDGRN